MSEPKRTIPLFPLGVVLLPSMPLPLHIFEERYKLMIGECWEQHNEFGVVYQDDRKIHQKGCTARVARITKRYDDERLDILTQGVNRFKIMGINEEKPYLQAKVVHFDDKREERVRETDGLIRDGIELLQQLDLMTGQTRDYAAISGLDYKTISFLFCYNDGFTPDEKQKFLELTSTNERITKSVESLRKVIELKQMKDEIKRIVGGNGNPRSK
jgi:Lon protease-like protein